jgi:hypothetical protein
MAGGHCRWTLQMDSAGGQCSFNAQLDSLDIAGRQCSWMIQVDSAGGVTFDLPEVHILKEDRQASAPLSARLGINPKHPRAN